MRPVRGRPGRSAASATSAPPTSSATTTISVSSPATVPSRSGRPARSSAEATTWAEPGGVRSTTRLAEWATSTTQSPQHPAQVVLGGELLGSGSPGWRRRSRRPGTRTLIAPRSSRSRDTVAWVATQPCVGQQLDELGLVLDRALLDELGRQVLALRLAQLGGLAVASRLPPGSSASRPRGPRACGWSAWCQITALGAVDHRRRRPPRRGARAGSAGRWPRRRPRPSAGRRP